MKPAFWRRLFPALVVCVVLAAACSPDAPDASLDADGTAAAIDEDQNQDPGDPAEAEDTQESDEADESDVADEEDSKPVAEPEGADASAQHGDRIDLGAFNNYDPTDPDATPLPVDPRVLIGELGNGLTYYLRSNDSPGESVVLNLVVNAGGVLDPEGQEGTAHFLEHMLFNGTERFSENELDQVLRDFGTDFGPDLNAFTGPDETVYILDVLLDDPEALDLAFTVLSEWASAATILPEDVDEERGIILDEYRLRDESASGRISNFLDAIYYKGTVYEGMLIGGSEQSNLSLTATHLRAYYETWYRPDNMAVVVVGDLPVTQMEQLVEEHFGGWEARSDASPAQPDRGAFTADFGTEPVTGVVTHPDHGPIYISLDWQLPAWPLDTAGGERLHLMEAVIAEMLEIRLYASYQAGLMSQASEPHIGAFAAARGLRLIGTNFQGSDLTQATTDFLGVVEGAAHYGFTPAELDQAVSAIRTSLEFELESEQTRQDEEYAFEYVDHFLTGADISSASDRANRLGALLDTYSANELTAHLRWVLGIAPPIVVSIGPDPSQVPTAQELRAAVEAAAPLAAPGADEALDVLLQAPDPVTPAREAALDLFDGTYEWEFPNGARVVFAPSNIAAGEVNVVAEGLGGWSTLSVGDSALVRHAVGAVASSGVGNASATQLDEYLATTTARVSPFIAETSEGFSGATGSDDLEDLFALMHLYITAPRITEIAVNEQIQVMQTRRANAETFPQWVSELALLDALYQGSPWYQFVPTQAQIDATTPDSLLHLYETRLSDVDDLMVAVIGDIDRATVADLAARYVGSLPSGDSDTFVNHRPGSPSDIERITISVNADAGATGFDVMFGVAAPVDTASVVIADVAQAVVNDLLTVRVREELGDAYSVEASVSAYSAFGTWEGRISSTGASEGLDAGHAQVVEILAGLIADGPTERDLAQAIAVVSDNYVLESNSLLINSLLSRQFVDDADVSTPARRRAALGDVSAADVQRFIALLFDLDNRIEVFRTAEEPRG